METIETTVNWAIEATVTTLQTVVYGDKTYNCTQIDLSFRGVLQSVCEFDSCELETSKMRRSVATQKKVVHYPRMVHSAVLLHTERSRVQISTRILVFVASQSPLTEEATDTMLNQATVTSFHPTSK
jgi:hypothetical protein